MDRLLLSLYRGSGSTEAWPEFLAALCEQLQADAAVLILRPPARDDRGQIFMAHADAALEILARNGAVADDPFAQLEAGTACNITDRLAPALLARTRFYRDVLQREDDIDLLALNIDFGAPCNGQLRIARRAGRPFGVLEKSLLMRLYPHLRAALDLFETTRRLTLENDGYARAIDQLAFGVIIINERGHVVRVNETASVIMKESQLLRVVGNYLHAADPDCEVLIAKHLQALLAGSADKPVRALKLESRKTGKSLYLLFKPIDRAAPPGLPAGIAVFLSHDTLKRGISIETLAKLYLLTGAEVALVTELLGGASIVEAAGALGISENTARTQLRSVFAKTDTHRQTDLIRLALTSLATIA